MSGPSAGPEMLQGVIPGGQAMAMQEPPSSSDTGPKAPALGGSTPEQMLQALSGGGAQAPAAAQAPEAPASGADAQAPAPGGSTPEQMLAALGGAPPVTPQAPDQPSSLAGTIGKALFSPVTALLDAAASAKDAPAAAQIASKFAKHPEGQRQIFQSIAGPGFETRVVDDAVEFKKVGEPDAAWRKIDPEWGSSIHGFITRLADFAPEVFETAVMGGSIATGAAEGAAAGAPVAGWGAIPGAVAGAAGAAAGGAAVAGAAREAMSRMLGSEADPNLGNNIALQAAGGAVMGGAGALFRRPAQIAAQWLSEQASTSTAAIAMKTSEYASKFNDIYRDITGKGAPSTEQAGTFARTTIGSATKELGERVGQVWDAFLPKSGDTMHPTKGLQQLLKDTLEDRGYSFELAPHIPGEPIENKLIMKAPEAGAGFTKASDPGLDKLYNLMGDNYITMEKSNGMTLRGIKDLHAEFQDLAGYGSADPTAVQKTYRAMYGALRDDRNGILGQLSQGTELEGVAKNAFSDYANKIDDLRLLSRAAEKSPEKFMNWMFKDADTAKLAKSVMSNNVDAESMNGWDATSGAWFKKQMTNAVDDKTGIVDLTKLYEGLIGKGGATDKTELAKVVMGPEKLEQLRTLGIAMSRTSWEKLLAKPDSVEAGAMIRAFTKFGMSGGRTAYGVDAIGALVSHDKSILSTLNTKGILQFAQEASTLQEKNYWLRASKMMTRMIDGTSVSMPGATGRMAKIPMEQSMIPVMLNAGVRPVGEDAPTQQAHIAHATQMFDEKQAERVREVEAEMQQARAQTAKGVSFPQVQLSTTGQGVPPQFPRLNAFAGKGHKH